MFLKQQKTYSLVVMPSNNTFKYIPSFGLFCTQAENFAKYTIKQRIRLFFSVMVGEDDDLGSLNKTEDQI